MLTSFGIFWSGEGAGVSWPGSDAALLAILAFIIVVSRVMVSVLRRKRASLVTAGAEA
jgi:uncharacterized membrane protein